MFGKRGPRRVARRTIRRAMNRRMRRRRVLIGGLVLLVGAGLSALKMSLEDAQGIETHTGSPPEELDAEELAQAASDLKINLEPVDDPSQ